ncbi:MAG TPA: phage holin family protein [Deltaproteobacteria bacterium]|nr:phage holin family protein [Deltaproteobacteria bacterium]
MGLLARPLAGAAGLYLASLVVEGVTLDGPAAAATAAAALALVNIFIKPVVKALTFPVNIATLGLFSLVMNGAFLMATASVITGFHVAGPLPALYGAAVVSLASAAARVFSRKF